MKDLTLSDFSSFL